MKHFLLGLTAVLSSFGAVSQNTMLYKISGNGLKQPSYLFGTIHITCEATLEKPVLDALDNTSQLYLELDMDDPSMQATMMSGMMMKGGKTMSSMVSEEDFKVLDDFVKEKVGVSAIMLNTMKPFMVSTMFLPYLLDCPMQSIESELVKVSKEQNEEIFGLEAVEEQLAVFDAIPYEVQMQELIKSVKSGFASDREEIRRVMELYKNKDLNSLLSSIADSDNKITAEHQDELLFTRNENWVPRIEKVMKEKPTFFGVGAAHLPGDKGVIELLKKKGYKVEPVQ